MKSFAFFMLLVSSVSFAQYSENSITREYDEYNVEYLAWCDQNKVMTQNNKGETRVLADCSSNNTVCRTYHIYRHFGPGHIVTAACEKPQ